jgi:probable HAF family extracellular repeat protein
MNAAFVCPANLVLLSLFILAGCGGGAISTTQPPVQGPPPTPSVRHYTVLDLPPLPGAGAAQAQGLNSVGDVVGYSVGSDGHAHAVIWKSGVPQDLGTADSFAMAVNASDQVAGYALSGSTPHAFLWQSGANDLGTLPGFDSSISTGINDAGTIVGVSFSYQNPASQQGFSWTAASGMQPILGASSALAIRGSQIAGMDYSNHAAIFDNGQTSDLGALVDTSVSTSVNSSGHAAGLSGTRAFFFDSTMHDLGLRDDWTLASATGVNDSNVVIGSGSAPGGVSHPFAWTSTFGLNDLDTLIPSGSGWTMETATGINTKGQICGMGEINGELHGVLLSPN